MRAIFAMDIDFWVGDMEGRGSEGYAVDDSFVRFLPMGFAGFRS